LGLSNPIIHQGPTFRAELDFIKHDGMRIMARRDGAGVRLITLNGNDFTSRFPFVVTAVTALPLVSDRWRSHCYQRHGLAEFDLIRHKRHGDSAVLCGFDLIELAGEDLRRASIEYRKRSLAKLLTRCVCRYLPNRKCAIS
jgi:bifunctional non-homologous end joining protein LigD